MLHIVVAVFFLSFAVTTAPATQPKKYSGNKTHHDSRTVLLGGLFPVSNNEDNQCGSLRTTAVEALEAMVYAIHTINKDRTLLPNISLTFDIRDTCSTPNKAFELYPSTGVQLTGHPQYIGSVGNCGSWLFQSRFHRCGKSV